MFDAGVRTHQTPNHILITHCHCDHSFELPTILAGDWKNPTNIYTPVDPKIIINFIHSSFTLMNNGKKKSPPFTVHQVKPGDTFHFTEGKKNFEVEVFQCYHTVDTVGYGISEIRNKLKEEFMGKEGRELAALKKEGIDICYPEKVSNITYLCDTSIDVFNNSKIFDYTHIMVECTILFEDQKESAYKNGHIYWGDLLPIVKSHPENQFILIHFSTRYSDDEIVSFFESEMKTHSIDNVFPWIN